MGKTRGRFVISSFLLASALGIAVVGSSMLKARHLRQLATHVAWQPVDFRLDRPRFDSAAYAESRGRATDDPDIESARDEFETGIRAYQAGNERGALAHFGRAVATAPGWPMARFYLGTARLSTGNPVAAAEDLQRALDAGFDPPEGSTAWWLAIARLYNGDFQDARELLLQVTESETSQAAQAESILDRLDEMEQENSS